MIWTYSTLRIGTMTIRFLPTLWPRNMLDVSFDFANFDHVCYLDLKSQSLHFHESWTWVVWFKLFKRFEVSYSWSFTRRAVHNCFVVHNSKWSSSGVSTLSSESQEAVGPGALTRRIVYHCFVLCKNWWSLSGVWVLEVVG